MAAKARSEFAEHLVERSSLALGMNGQVEDRRSITAMLPDRGQERRGVSRHDHLDIEVVDDLDQELTEALLEIRVEVLVGLIN